MQEAQPDAKGLWHVPAGKLEPDETPEEAVKREVFEETGLEVEMHHAKLMIEDGLRQARRANERA